MSTRETKIVLDRDQAFHEGVASAVADQQRVVRVRISPALQSLALKGTRGAFEAVHENAEVQAFYNAYDVYTKRSIRFDQPCGCLYGANVYKDDTLAGHTLVIESEPIPA